MSISSNNNNFSWRKVVYQILSSFNILQASISINRSQIILLVKLNLLFYNKILREEKKIIDKNKNSTDQIQHFLLLQTNNKKNKFILPALRINLGIEGSGILIRLLKVKVQKDQPLLSNIIWQLKQSMPFALSTAYIQYKQISKTGAEVQVIVCLLKKDFLDNLLNVFQQLNLPIANLLVTSLHLASPRFYQQKNNLGIFVQGKDYNLSLKKENQEITFFEILHDDDSANSFRKIQALWNQDNNQSSSSNIPIYFYRQNLTLDIEVNDYNRFEGLTKSKLNNLINLDHFDIAEATALLGTKSLSPQLLPKSSIKQVRKSKAIHQLLGWFLLFQLFIPFLYQQLNQAKVHLIRNTSYSTINNEIRKSQQQFNSIVENQKKIIQLIKMIRFTKNKNSQLLNLLSSRNLSDMVLTRVSKKNKKILIEGFSKNIQTLSVFMESLEEDNRFGSPQLKKTTRKGDVTAFQIKLKIPREKRK